MPRWNNKNCGFQKGHTPFGGAIKGSKRPAMPESRKEKISETLKVRGIKPSVRYCKRGLENCLWKGTTKESLRIRGQIEYRIWRDLVFERDRYTCQMPGCNGKERYLNAHHIKVFSKHKELRFDISNGITLCRLCHNKTKGKEEKYESIFLEILKGIV